MTVLVESIFNNRLGNLPSSLLFSCPNPTIGLTPAGRRVDLLGAESTGAQKAATSRRRERADTQSFMVLLGDRSAQS